MSAPKLTTTNLGFKILQPGILSLLQDAGRFGKHNIGLTNGGPLDKLSYDWANRLLDNDPNACVIEASIGGLTLQAELDTQIAVTGGDAQLSINQQAVPSWQTHNVKAGDKISFGFAQINTRHYLAVKGGFQVNPMFDSCATVVREKLGGLDGSALQQGDILACSPFNSPSPTHDTKQRSLSVTDRPDYIQVNKDQEIKLRVILGYQQDTFSALQKARFFSQTFTVSDKCDRMGFRLTGPEITSELHTQEGGMLSEGICYGAIQVPADGQPIVLLNDRQTIGGYPKIGAVFSLDIPKLTQRLPGTKLHFEAININDAQSELHLAQFRYKNVSLKTL